MPPAARLGNQLALAGTALTVVAATGGVLYAVVTMEVLGPRPIAPSVATGLGLGVGLSFQLAGSRVARRALVRAGHAPAAWGEGLAWAGVAWSVWGVAQVGLGLDSIENSAAVLGPTMIFGGAVAQSLVNWSHRRHTACGLVVRPMLSRDVVGWGVALSW